MQFHAYRVSLPDIVRMLPTAKVAKLYKAKEQNQYYFSLKFSIKNNEGETNFSLYSVDFKMTEGGFLDLLSPCESDIIE